MGGSSAPGGSDEAWVLGPFVPAGDPTELHTTWAERPRHPAGHDLPSGNLPTFGGWSFDAERSGRAVLDRADRNLSGPLSSDNDVSIGQARGSDEIDTSARDVARHRGILLRSGSSHWGGGRSSPTLQNPWKFCLSRGAFS